MIVCGIEIRASEAIFCILRRTKNKIINETGKFKKLKLYDDENEKEIRSFYETLKNHFDVIAPTRIGIIKRNKKGEFAGGAITFKIEALVQLYPEKIIRLISPHTLRSYKKKNTLEMIDVSKYQENACVLAHYLLDL